MSTKKFFVPNNYVNKTIEENIEKRKSSNYRKYLMAVEQYGIDEDYEEYNWKRRANYEQY